jgi:hypothetical protein
LTINTKDSAACHIAFQFVLYKGLPSAVAGVSIDHPAPPIPCFLFGAGN